MKTLIRKALVVTLDDQNRILPQGDILVEDGTIRYVIPSPESDPAGDIDVVIDASEMIAVPGLVNAHSHGISNLNRGQIHGRPLEIWRQYLKSSYRDVTPEAIYLSGMLGSMELLKAGVTTVVDHFYAFSEAENQGAEYIMESWRDVGIRGVLAPMIIDVNFENTVPLKVDPNDAKAVAEVRRISQHENKETLDSVDRMLKRELGRHPRTHFMIGPGAPHRCTDGLLQRAHRLASEYDIHMHMHVAETRTQFHHTRRTFGVTPVGRLHGLGVLDHRMTMAHSIWLTDEDIARVAEGGTSVVHNPSANMKLADGIAAIPEMLEAGINVALGTDGSGSNDAQNLWLEIRAAALIHNCRFVDYERWPTANQVLRMATQAGARSAGLGGKIGALTPGLGADIALLNRYTPAFMPLNDVQAQLVFCEHGASVDTVMVGGEIMVAGGKLLHVNERDIYRRLEKAMSEVGGAMRTSMAGAADLEPALREMYFRENAGVTGWLSGPVRE